MTSVAIEYFLIVRHAHLLQEEFEPPFAHVLGLVFVLTEPRKSEFTHAGAHILYEVSKLGSARITVYHAPWVSMADHMEDVTYVTYFWWCQASSPRRICRPVCAKFVQVACIIVDYCKNLWIESHERREKQIPLAQALTTINLPQRCNDSAGEACAE